VAEIPLIEQWFVKIGDSLPSSMRDELEPLKLRLGRVAPGRGGPGPFV
jgi:phosphoenolpyruvate carboxykinase (GTP)